MRFILSMAITGSIGMGLGAVLIFFRSKKYPLVTVNFVFAA
jgi:dephospho-CoA kinase